MTRQVSAIGLAVFAWAAAGAAMVHGRFRRPCAAHPADQKVRGDGTAKTLALWTAVVLAGAAGAGERILWQADFRPEAKQVELKRRGEPPIKPSDDGVSFVSACKTAHTDVLLPDLPAVKGDYRFTFETRFLDAAKSADGHIQWFFRTVDGSEIYLIQREKFLVVLPRSPLGTSIGNAYRGVETSVGPVGAKAPWVRYQVDVTSDGWTLSVKGAQCASGPVAIGAPKSFRFYGPFRLEVRNLRIETLPPPPPVPAVQEPVLAVDAWHGESNRVCALPEALSPTAGGFMLWCRNGSDTLRFENAKGERLMDFRIHQSVNCSVDLVTETATNSYQRKQWIGSPRSEDWYHFAFLWQPDGTVKTFLNGSPAPAGFDCGLPNDRRIFGNRLGEVVRVVLLGRALRPGNVENLLVFKRPVANAEVLAEYRARMPLDLVIENAVVPVGKPARLGVTLAPGGHFMRPAPVRPFSPLPATVDVAIELRRFASVPRDPKRPRQPYGDRFWPMEGAVSTNLALRVDRPTEVFAPERVFSPGRYQAIVSVRPAGATHAPYVRTLCFSAGAETDLSSVPVTKESWKTVKTLCEARFASLDQFAAVEGKDAKIVDSPLGVYAETGLIERDRFGILLQVPGEALGKPCLLSFDWPDDKVRSMGLYLYREGGNGCRDRLQGGIQSGREFALSGKMQRAEWLVFPSTSNMLFEVRTMVTGWPAAIANVKLEQIAEPFPRLKVHAPEGLPGRHFGNTDEDQTFYHNLNCDLDGSVAGTTFETLRYLAYTGQDVFRYSIARYEYTFGPVDSSTGSGMFPARQGELGYIVDQFGKNGVGFEGKVALVSVPDISHLRQLDSDARRRGLVARDREGLERGRFGGGAIQSNPANPAFRKLYFDYFFDFVTRYAQGFSGLWVDLGWSCLAWENLQIGYEDWTVNAFAAETGVRVPGVPREAKKPAEFLARYDYLTSTNNPSVRAKWLAWRAARVTAFVAELAARARRLAPGMKLTVNAPTDDGAYERHGVDLAAIAKIPGVRLGIGRCPTVHRFRLTRNPRAVTDEKLARFDSDWADCYRRDQQEIARLAAVQDGVVPSWENFGCYFETPGSPPKVKGRTFATPFQDADVKPWGRHWLKEAAFAVGIGDTFEYLVGGQPLGTLGAEREAREFAQAFRALPALPFKTMDGCDPQTADVVGRTCETKNGTYFYFVNLTDRPQRAKSPYWFYLDLSSDETVFGKTVGLKPYELRSFLKR